MNFTTKTDAFFGSSSLKTLAITAFLYANCMTVSYLCSKLVIQIKVIYLNKLTSYTHSENYFPHALGRGVKFSECVGGRGTTGHGRVDGYEMAKRCVTASEGLLSVFVCG